MSRLILVAFGVLIVNLPFGFWRASTRRFSSPWFAAIHLPIPFVVALRLVSGLGWQLRSFPIVVMAYFLGQCFGGMLRALVRIGKR